MGCPWLPYCMLLLSPQINREHKFQPGPGPADTLQPPVRFLKISRKEDGMRWSRSCRYNQKKLYPGEILEFLYLCGIVLYPLYFSFYGFFKATDSKGWSEWHNAIQCDEAGGWHQHSSLLPVLTGHQHSSSHHPGLKTNFHSRPRARVRRNIIWETRTIPLILLKP